MDDLDKAIDSGVGRTLTRPPANDATISWLDVRTAQPGNDSVALMPIGICVLGGELLVADAGPQRVYRFGMDGAMRGVFGRRGEGPGEFQRMSAMACSPDKRQLLVADPGNGRVTFFESDGTYMGFANGPKMPQGIPYYGSFAVANDGTWFHSWLGSRVGPYLEGSAWDSVRVVERWARNGEPIDRFGEPFEFSDPVIRRVFNKTDLAVEADTVWVLYQALAAVVAYPLSTEQAGDTIRLSVYHRGIDPVVEVGGGIPGGYRRNRAYYYPNVDQIVALDGGLFATIRFVDWEQRWVERSGGFTDLWPSSAVEIFDRTGDVISVLPFPGRGEFLAADGKWLAIVTEDFETGRSDVLLGSVPDHVQHLVATAR